MYQLDNFRTMSWHCHDMSGFTNKLSKPNPNHESWSMTLVLYIFLSMFLSKSWKEYRHFSLIPNIYSFPVTRVAPGFLASLEFCNTVYLVGDFYQYILKENLLYIYMRYCRIFRPIIGRTHYWTSRAMGIGKLANIWENRLGKSIESLYSITLVQI